MKKKLMKFASIIVAISLVIGGWSMAGGNVVCEAADVQDINSQTNDGSYDTLVNDSSLESAIQKSSSLQQIGKSDELDKSEYVDSGTCGDNLSWIITVDTTDSNRTLTLTISGTGDMEDYLTDERAPWSPVGGNIDNVIIEEGVTSIGNHAFGICTSLTNATIADSVTSIGSNAFDGCLDLKSIKMPNSLTNIGEYAFNYCWDLNSITIPDGVVSINNNSFSSCRSLSSITIPDSVMTIGDNAFDGCSNLNKITMPNQLTSIGSYAFQNCNALNSIIIPDSVTRIGSSTFKGCDNLVSVTLSNNVKSIDNYTFQDCKSLTNVIVPNSVSSIGSYAFQNCVNMKYIVIPESVITISSSVFEGCNNLHDIYYMGSEDDWSDIRINSSNDTALSEIYIHYNSTGPEDTSLFDERFSVKVLTGWNKESETASFSAGITYHINDNTDLSFLNILDILIGQKVLVVEDETEIGLLKGIYPVEEITGKVSEWNTSSIVLNGEEYPAAKDWSMNDILVDKDATVLCYLHEGTVVGIETPETKSGVLQEWNGQTSEITIDDNVYIVKTDDLSFLNSIQLWMGHSIDYILLGDKVIDVSLPDYSDRYTAKVEEYNAETGEVYFTDGQSYFMSEDLEESPSDYIGKWVVYTVQTSQDQGVHLTSLELVKSEMIVTMKINQNNVFYKEGQYSFDSENFVDRSDFEIPYTVTVENRTNASGAEALDQLRQDEEFDITIDDVEMDIQSGFNFGWLNDGEVQSIGNGTVIHAGNSVTAEGYIKPDIWYSPEELTNTYNVFCTVDSSSGEDSAMDTITVTINYSDAPTDELEIAAAQALDEISDNVAMSMDDSFFDQNTTNRIADALLSIAIMAKAEPQDLEEALTEDLFDQIFGDWKLDTGATTYDVPVQIAVDTEEYGELIFEFRMHLTSFNLNGTDYGLFGSIDYSIVGGKGINGVPINLRSRSNVGVISRSDVTAFCNAAYELAEKEIKTAYNKVTGDDLNKVADIVFGQTVKQILEENNTWRIKGINCK